MTYPSHEISLPPSMFLNAAWWDREKLRAAIEAEIGQIRSYTPKIAVFGNTGAGKSSLCNALFGKDVAKVSDVEACTRNPQEIFLQAGERGLVLIDVPGIGESKERDDEYMKLYASLLPQVDLALWVVKGDSRALGSAVEAYNAILKPQSELPVVFVLNQADKISPAREWNHEAGRPGPKQAANIQETALYVAQAFDVPPSWVVPVAAEDPSASYNLVELTSRIVRRLPDRKKTGFAREARPENVSEETRKEAETGLWSEIKRLFSGVWENVKGTVADLIVEIGSKAATELLTRGGKKFF